MDALPDIERPVDQAVNARTADRQSRGIGAITAGASLLSVLVISISAAVLSDLYGTDNLRKLLGLKDKSDMETVEHFYTHHKVRIDVLNEQMTIVGTRLDDYDQAVADFRSQLAGLSNRLDAQDKATQALAMSAVELSAMLDTVKANAALQKTAQDKQDQPRKTRSQTTEHLSLISIRSQGGRDLATVRQGADEQLLLAGDSWKGWTLVSVEPGKGKAFFKVRGRTRMLTL